MQALYLLRCIDPSATLGKGFKIRAGNCAQDACAKTLSVYSHSPPSIPLSSYQGLCRCASFPLYFLVIKSECLKCSERKYMKCNVRYELFYHFELLSVSQSLLIKPVGLRIWIQTGMLASFGSSYPVRFPVIIFSSSHL